MKKPIIYYSITAALFILGATATLIYASSPKRTVEKVLKAVQTRDTAQLEQYVDIDAVTESAAQNLVEDYKDGLQNEVSSDTVSRSLKLKADKEVEDFLSNLLSKPSSVKLNSYTTRVHGNVADLTLVATSAKCKGPVRTSLLMEKEGWSGWNVIRAENLKDVLTSCDNNLKKDLNKIVNQASKPKEPEPTKEVYVPVPVQVSAPAPTPAFNTNATVVGDPGWTNIRTGPGTRNSVVGGVYPGDRIYVTSSGVDQGGYPWYEAYFPSEGINGWIAGQLVQLD